MVFSVAEFMPYLLNQAAEAASARFKAHYRAHYGMLRTEWRVLFHLGCYGAMSAREICDRSALHKTKVSRAVAALTQKRYLTRSEDSADRRREILTLTRLGTKVFDDLCAAAEAYEEDLLREFSEDDRARLKSYLMRLSGRI